MSFSSSQLSSEHNSIFNNYNTYNDNNIFNDYNAYNNTNIFNNYTTNNKSRDSRELPSWVERVRRRMLQIF